MRDFVTNIKPVTFFSAILVTVIIIVIFINVISEPLENNPNISLRFHLPRDLSESEKAGPPLITGNVRVYQLTPLSTKINWNDVIQNGPYDIVVIGDSFTGTCKAGIYLTNRLSADNNVSLLNIFTNSNSFFEYNPGKTLIYLTNNGFFNKIHAKTIILETCERGNSIVDFSKTNTSKNKPINLHKNRKENQINELNISTIDRKNPVEEFLLQLTWISDYFDAVTNPILKRKTRIINLMYFPITGQTIDGEVHSMKLHKPMFSQKEYASTLLYHTSETSYCTVNNTDLAIRVNDKLNTISKKLANENITLIYLPGISSYTTHYPFMENPPLPRNDIYYDVLDSLNKSYVFVNTKEISDNLLFDGVIDLHGVGDLAHWNWPLTKKIADNFNHIIDSQKRKNKLPE